MLSVLELTADRRRVVYDIREVCRPIECDRSQTVSVVVYYFRNSTAIWMGRVPIQRELM